MTTEAEQVPSWDFIGQPLTVGDSVAIASTGGPTPGRLFTGRIALIHKGQICVESGHLITLVGEQHIASGGQPAHIRYATVHRITKPDGTAKPATPSDAGGSVTSHPYQGEGFLHPCTARGYGDMCGANQYQHETEE
ncbi:hypothetical protein [Streptomyces sp. NPDC056987]|uniref:hypothetical protein n=1 Tax=Streptomyces sp. NPDC056987 TaxID=3345988 RepID=UPI003640BE01